jgi:hypothetical protein
MCPRKKFIAAALASGAVTVAATQPPDGPASGPFQFMPVPGSAACVPPRHVSTTSTRRSGKC